MTFYIFGSGLLQEILFTIKVNFFRKKAFINISDYEPSRSL